MKHLCIYLVVLFSFISFNAFAEKTDSIKIKKVLENQLELISKFDSLHSITSIEEKKEYNKKLLEQIVATLNIPESFGMSFDTIRPFGKIQSDDGLVSLYTYNLPLEFGEQEYFGFLQYYDKKNDSVILYELHDKSMEIQQPEYQKLYSHNWYGALYYKIITEKYKGTTHYVILAFDFNNLLSAKKIVEILKFNELGFPQFGSPIIKYKNKTHNRLIFEFNARATMILNYNPKTKMVTFDHLSPSRPSMEGNYQFYGPDFSYDGLKFEKGFWVHYQDIDVRNF